MLRKEVLNVVGVLRHAGAQVYPPTTQEPKQPYRLLHANLAGFPSWGGRGISCTSIRFRKGTVDYGQLAEYRE